MNLPTEKKLMDMENRLVVAKGEGEDSFAGTSTQGNRFENFVKNKFVSNEILLYSTGNYI